MGRTLRRRMEVPEKADSTASAALRRGLRDGGRGRTVWRSDIGETAHDETEAAPPVKSDLISVDWGYGSRAVHTYGILDEKGPESLG